MSDKDARKLAKKIVSLERRLDAQRAKQLPFSSVTLEDGSSHGVVDGVGAGRDAFDLAETHDDALSELSDVADGSAVESTFLPERLAGTDSSADAGYDVGVAAWERAEQVRLEALAELDAARTELDGRLDDAGSRLDVAEGKLSDAEQLLDETFGLVTDVKETAEQAVAHVLEEFAVSAAGDAPPVSGWSLTPPAYVPGQFVWKRTTEELGDGTLRVGIPVLSTGPEGAAGADAALLRITSSNGTAFKNNAISTVLTVTVFLGARQIVNIDGLRDAFGPAAYLEWWWRNRDDTEFGLILSNDERLSRNGFDLTVSPADVDEQTVFQCVLQA